VELDQADRFGDIAITWTGVADLAGGLAEIDVYDG
jgi:hypothetical protein